MIDDEYEDSIVGTPQGGNLSPLLANIMLNELDKEMEKRGDVYKRQHLVVPARRPESAIRRSETMS